MSHDLLTHDLIHDPSNGGNPYGVAWGRFPTVPDPGEAVDVGARAPGGQAPVGVEWEAGGQRGHVAATADGEVHGARIGPFAGPARYRFVAGPAATPWFDLPSSRWREAPFTGVRAVAGVLEATFGDHVLRLEPAERRLDWRVLPVGAEAPGSGVAGAEGPGAGAPGLRGHAGPWHAEVAGGGLVLHGPGCRWELVAPAWLDVDGEMRELRLGWRLGDPERLYGTGERFDAVDQRGRRPDVRVYEQYKQQGARTYFPLPMVLSSAGWLVSVASDERLRFDLGASVHDLCTVRIPTAGPAAGAYRHGSPGTVLRDYVGAVGRPSPLPLWAYGPWMSGNEWNSEARVRDVVQRTLDEAVPATVLVIEAWSDETTFYLFNDTASDPVGGDEPVPVASMRHGGRWPDPKALVDWLHSCGLRVLLWQIPAIKDVAGHPQHDADVAHAEREGLVVGTAAGASYRNRGWWFPGARIVDFTNPRARQWWFGKRAWLLDHLGVDGFKTDGGEHLWGDDVVSAAGERGDAAGNRYPTHYLSAYHAFLREHGHDRPVTFSRAGFTGAQAFPAHWAGDEDSTWEACRAALVAGLSAGLSGVAFWSWDLAGFSGPLPSPELYRRSAAMAAFCPVMQYHSELNEYREPPIDRTPWNVAEQSGAPEVLDTYRFYARLRMNLVPYLAQLGEEAAADGTPLLRALLLEAPDDPEALGVEDQFFLGPDLLVAPVLEPGVDSRRVYLPEGRWHDLWTGAPVEGGWHEVPAPVGSIPVFVRAGAVVALWMPEQVGLGEPVGLPGDGGRLVLMVVPGTGRRRVRHPVGGQWFEVSVHREGRMLTVEAAGLGEPVTVWLRGAGPAGADSGIHELSPSAPSVTVPVDAP